MSIAFKGGNNMKKQLLGLAALAGLAVCGTTAQAQTYASSFHIVNASNPAMFGDFNVVINQTGTNFAFTVTPTGGTITDAQNAAFTFFDNTTIGGLTGKLGIDTSAGATHAATNGPYDAIYSGGNTTVTFNQANPAAFFSSQPLTGNVGLTSGTAQRIRVTLSDGGSQTQELVAVPEASSLALLLPGLVPVGIALRRRRAARNN